MSKYGTKGKGIKLFLICSISISVIILVSVVTVIIVSNVPKYDAEKEGFDLKKTVVERNKAKS
ncbi:MAG: hypothetical protein KAR05_00175 [Candidatus Omnitrophica bacterium]|nr:hypothetical protein [Candidatus Omnitrophota bacterium]